MGLPGYQLISRSSSKHLEYLSLALDSCVIGVNNSKVIFIKHIYNSRCWKIIQFCATTSFVVYLPLTAHHVLVFITYARSCKFPIGVNKVSVCAIFYPLHIGCKIVRLWIIQRFGFFYNKIKKP